MQLSYLLNKETQFLTRQAQSAAIALKHHTKSRDRVKNS
jgi:hypothetical protein